MTRVARMRLPPQAFKDRTLLETKIAQFKISLRQALLKLT
jgi:hypothetical protein